MSTIRERLEKLIGAQSARSVVFVKNNVASGASRLLLDGHVIADSVQTDVPEDRELQVALKDIIKDTWDPAQGKYIVVATPDGIWAHIQYTISDQYSICSNRSVATKRKTERFIQDIKIDDKFLPNYLVQVFLKIKSPEYAKMSREERELMFEQFETLRRTYGKR